jgi:hypothetical protein
MDRMVLQDRMELQVKMVMTEAMENLLMNLLLNRVMKELLNSG